MKKILLIISLFCGLPGYGQALVGNQIATQLKVTSYGSIQNALVSLPDDYNTTKINYPLIIFLHGLGEIGSKPADLAKLNNQGLPYVIAKGGKVEAVNPVDKKLYKFIVISPQHWAWTTPPENIDYILKTIGKTYRIDTNRVYITGLSAGGLGVITAVTYSQALTNKITAIVPMSPAAPDTTFTKRFKFFTQSKTGAWFLAGNNGDQPYLTNSKQYNDSINKYYPGGSKVSTFNGNHCCWMNIYNPSHRVDGMNIYEWMLTRSRNDTTILDPPKPPSHEICIGQADSIKKIILLMKNGSYREYDSVSMIIPTVQLELQ